MNKIFFGLMFSIMFILLFAQNTPLEARHHCHNNRVQVGLRANMAARDAYVVQRYARPVAVTPVVVTQDLYYSPAYIPARTAYVAPVYVEEVRVVPRCRPVTFGGLSLSFNLF